MTGRHGSKRWGTGELGVLIALGLGHFAVFMVRIAAPYKAIELGASAFGVGLVGGAFGALTLFLAVPIGRAVDRSGARPFILGGMGLIALAPIVEAMAGSVETLVVGQALLGVGQMSLAIGIQTRVARSGSPLSADERFARLAIVAGLSAFVAPMVAGLTIEASSIALFDVSGLTATFWLAATIGVGGLGLMTLVPRPMGTRGSSQSDRPARISLLAVIGRPGMAAALLTSLAVVTTLDILITYLPLVGVERGISPTIIGALLSVRSGAALLSRFALPWMLRRFGRDPLMVRMLAIAALSMVGVVFDMPVAMLAILLFFVGVGLGVGQPMTIAWTAATAPTAVGSALAVRMTTSRGGQLLLISLLGAAASAFGTGVIFGVSAASLLSCSLIVRRRVER